MGLFDDLIPSAQAAPAPAPAVAAPSLPAQANGLFDDLIPGYEPPVAEEPSWGQKLQGGIYDLMSGYNAAMLAKEQGELDAAMQSSPEDSWLQTGSFVPRDQRVAAAKQRRAEALKNLSYYNKRSASVPQGPAMENFNRQEGFLDTLGAFAEAPVDVGSSLVLRSLPASAPSIAGGIGGFAVGGPLGAAAGAGLGSAITEYGSGIAEQLREFGADLNDEASIMAVWEANQGEILARAAARAAIVGGTDALTGGLTGRIARTAMTPIKKTAAGTGVQMVGGGGGEAAAEVFADEKEISWPNVLGEVIAEGAHGGLEAGGQVGVDALQAPRQPGAPETPPAPSYGLFDDLVPAPEAPVAPSAENVNMAPQQKTGAPYDNPELLAEDALSVLRSEVPGLSEVRRPWDSSVSRVDGFQNLPARYGPEAEGPLNRQDQQRSGLLPGQLPLGDSAGAIAQPPGFREGLAGQDSYRASRETGQPPSANDLQSAQSRDVGGEGFDFREAANGPPSALPVSQRGYAADQRMGEEGWDQAYDASAAPQEGLDRGASADGRRPLRQASLSQVAHHDTPEFKRWFGGSKIVDEKGAPRVMYHGTRGDFPAFHRRVSDVGMHFGTVGQAEDRLSYTRRKMDGSALHDPSGDNVMPVYLSIKNPYRMNDIGYWGGDNMQHALRMDFPADLEKIKKISSSADARDFLKRKGYDGIVYKNDGEVKGSTELIMKADALREAVNQSQLRRGKKLGSFDQDDQQQPEYLAWTAAQKASETFRKMNAEDSYIVFDASQIKSVHNRGTYNPRKQEMLLQVGVPLLDKPLKIEGKVTVKAIGEAMTADHAKKVKRKLYPEKSEADYQRVLKDATSELESQLTRDNSGVGWYSKDVALALQLAQRVYPTLSEQSHRNLYMTFAGIFSNGLDPDAAFMLSSEAYEGFLKTGKIPVNRADNFRALGKEVPMSAFDPTKPSGWSKRNDQNEKQLEFVGKIIEREGSLEAGLEWLMTPQPRTEVNAAMRADDLYKEGRYTTKAEIAGPPVYGVMALGEKLGRYTMGLHGVEVDAGDATIDLWFIRTYRRLVGRLMEGPIGGEGVVGQPNDVDRRVIWRMVKDLAGKFKELTAGDIQAVLWFFEKRLWGAQGLRVNEGTNSSGARKLLRSKGIDDGSTGNAEGVGSGTQAEQAVGLRDGGRRQGEAGPEVSRLPKLPEQSPGPNGRIVAAAKKYLEARGLPHRRQAFHVSVDPQRGKRLADAYEAMNHAPDNATVKAAYKAMADEVKAQYQAVIDMGLKVERIAPGSPDPYPAGPKEVLIDLQKNHLWFYPTASGFGTLTEIKNNPLLEPTEFKVGEHVMLVNDLFRVVHDVFGHGLEGAGFGASGEENAWQAHVRMFTPLAARAMTSETRGQNSWVNFGPYGEANRANQKETVYADQKTGLLPEWAATEGIIDDQAEPQARRSKARPRQEALAQTGQPGTAEAGVQGSREPQARVDRGDGRADLTHWSEEKRDVIDPEKFGSNPYIRGAERERARRPNWINRSYYGVGGSYRKEGMLRDVRHDTSIEVKHLYDFKQNPLGLPDRDLNQYEAAIKRAGFKGYFVHHELGTVAAVFEALKPERVTVEGQQVTLQQVGRPANDNTNIIKIEDLREKKELQKFHGKFMDEIRERAAEMARLNRLAIEQGVFDGVEVGDRYFNKKNKGSFSVEGRYLREIKPAHMKRHEEHYERLGAGKPLLVQVGDKFYAPMLRTKEPDMTSEAYWGLMKALDYKKVTSPQAVLKQVGNDNFKRWFGDSKVVDADGKPLVVYHGTGAKFDIFDPVMRGSKNNDPDAREAFFFSDREEVAQAYAGNQDDGTAPEIVVEAHLSIKNPRIVDGRGRLYRADWVAPEIAAAKREGRDGVIIHNIHDGGPKSPASTVYAVFEANQIKSATNNSGAFDPTKQSILAQAKPEATFFSALIRAVQGIKQEKAPASQWMSMIKNLPGTKQEEIAWTQLEEFLASATGTVTKTQILDHLNVTQVKVEEVMQGGEDRNALMARLIKERFGPGIKLQDLSALEQYQMQQEWNKQAANNPAMKPTKFHQYQLHGGENYRELLLTLPEKEITEEEARKHIGRNVHNTSKWYVKMPGGAISGGSLTEQEALDFAKRAWTGGGNAFRSSHFDTPNILAHIRFNERTVDGKKVLFIEEIQSDWHQAGRKRGYATKPAKWTVSRQTPEGKGVEFWKVDWEDGTYSGGYFSEASARDAAEARAVQKAGVRDAPFKTSWAELAFKRMLRYAAENGFDKIAWTTGAVQVDRYNSALRNSVDTLYWEKTDKGIHLSGFKGNEEVVNTHEKEDMLSDAIGKSMADQIISDPRQAGKFEGDAIQISDTGMAAFYDKILVNIANKLGKKFDAKVGRTPVGDPQNLRYEGPDVSEERLRDLEISYHGTKLYSQFKAIYEATNINYLNPMTLGDAVVRYGSHQVAEILGGKLTSSPVEMPSIDITQSMRDSVMMGQPLFKPGPTKRSFDDYWRSASANRRDEIRHKVHAMAEQMLGHRIRIETPRTIADEFGRSTPNQGDFNPDDRTIKVAIDVALSATGTLAHEAIHAMRDLGIITTPEWALLKRAAEPLMRDTRAIYEQGYRDRIDITEEQLQDLMYEEAVAELFNYKVTKSERRGIDPLVVRLVNKIKQFLEALRNYFNRDGFRTTTGIFDDMLAGKFRDRKAVVGKPGRGYYLTSKNHDKPMFTGFN